VNYLPFRNFFRRLIINALSVKTRPKPGIHILNGHYISRDNKITKEVFAQLLDKLIFFGIEFVDFENAVELINLKKIPKDKCLVSFSFDDGFEECFTKIKPVLNLYKIKAAFFINPNFIDGNELYRSNFTTNVVKANKAPMSWEQIQKLSIEGHTIGAHTLDHLNLNIDNRNELEFQIKGSKDIIELKINKSCNHFAFPFGRIEDISELGVVVAKENFPFVYSQSDFRNYFSFNGRVINRRHFECDWPVKHVLYFLKNKKL